QAVLYKNKYMPAIHQLCYTGTPAASAGDFKRPFQAKWRHWIIYSPDAPEILSEIARILLVNIRSDGIDDMIDGAVFTQVHARNAGRYHAGDLIVDRAQLARQFIRADRRLAVSAEQDHFVSNRCAGHA